jgi:cysteine desulfurase
MHVGSASIMEPSYVLKAMGVATMRRTAAIRFGLGRFNTEEEVDCAAARAIEAVKKLRELRGQYDSSN